MTFNLTPLTLVRTRWALSEQNPAGRPLTEIALRGAILMTYRRSVCPPSLLDADCSRCDHLDACSYGQVFAARPAAFESLRTNRTIPRPYLFRVLPDHSKAFELTLFGSAAALLPRFASIIERIGETGIYLRRGRPPWRFSISGKTLLPLGERPASLQFPFEPRSVQPWIDSIGPFGTVRIVFKTPTAIKAGGIIQRRADPEGFFSRLRDRLSLLSSAWCGTPLDWDYRAIPGLARQIKVIEEDFRFVDIRRRSGTTGHTYFQSGFVGAAVWKNLPLELWPLLAAGTLTGVGKGCAFGGGRYSVEDLDDTVHEAPWATDRDESAHPAEHTCNSAISPHGRNS